jgi:hypothetical protein
MSDKLQLVDIGRQDVLEKGLRPACAGRRLIASNFVEPLLDNNALFSYNEQMTRVLRVDLAIPSH